MKQSLTKKILPRSIVLLLGSFDPTLYASLKARGVKNVFVLEGRPSLESSRESCAQLLKCGITPTVIADNTAGFLFNRGWVKEVCVAYQTSDEQGLLCDIGALILGVLAKKHHRSLSAFPGIKKNRFVGAPDSVCTLAGARVAPTGVKGYVPLIEFVPKKYVRRIYG